MRSQSVLAAGFGLTETRSLGAVDPFRQLLINAFRGGLAGADLPIVRILVPVHLGEPEDMFSDCANPVVPRKFHGNEHRCQRPHISEP